MMTTFSLPVLPAIKKIEPNAREDHFALGSATDFHTALEGVRYHNGPNSERSPWLGGSSFNEARARVLTGDLSAVAESEAMLSALEAQCEMPSASRAFVADIVGACPNVPAYIAGQPLSMRRRARTTDDCAPLTIVVDLASSGGIGADTVKKRGVAVLALVRAISARRPIELWAGCSLDAVNPETGSGCDGSHVYFRIDTAPLDLARAAFLLTHPAVPRALVYAYARAKFKAPLRWSYGTASKKPKIDPHMPAILGRVFTGDALMIPSIHLHDRSITAPVDWIKEHLHKVTGEGADTQEAA